MGSKLRPLYDKLYIGVETYLLAQEGRRDAKKYARGLGKNPEVEEKYADLIRPYWRRFKVPVPKKYWFTLFANKNQPFSAQYIPDDLWYGHIIPHYNNLIFAKALQDKCLHNILFSDVKRPETVVKNVAGVFYDDDLNLLTRQQAVARCHDAGRIVIKPSVGSGQGHSIRFLESGSLSDREIEDIFRQYGQNYIVQKKLAQHPELARFNPSSLNTVRVITFLHNDRVHILSAVLRTGGAGSEVDNTSQGGFQITIRPDGHLMPTGFSHAGGRWHYDDKAADGLAIAGLAIPSYDRIIDTVRAQAARMGHFKIIGWDMAVDTEGMPVLVEYNVIPGQNQESDGPTFGALTDEVLEEVFGRR